MEAWKELSEKERNKVAVEALQCEWYDGDGNQYEDTESYYNATRRIDPRRSLFSEDEMMILAVEEGYICGGC